MIPTRNTVIHCPTKELARKVVMVIINDECDSREVNSIVDTSWSQFQNNTCYRIDKSNKTILYSDRGSCIAKHYNILKAEEFIKLEKKKQWKQEI